jgi:hypothetical protein
VQRAVSKASISFWPALQGFARHDWHVPAKGWDEIGPDHHSLSVRIQVPLRPCLAIDWVFCLAAVHCAEGDVVGTCKRHMVRFVFMGYPPVGVGVRVRDHRR